MKKIGTRNRQVLHKKKINQKAKEGGPTETTAAKR